MILFSTVQLRFKTAPNGKMYFKSLTISKLCRRVLEQFDELRNSYKSTLLLFHVSADKTLKH